MDVRPTAWWFDDVSSSPYSIQSTKTIRTAPRVKGTLALEDLKDADLVVEAVFEDMDLKRGAFLFYFGCVQFVLCEREVSQF